jgi:hemoglobin
MMSETKDIKSVEDIKLFVDSFYSLVKTDDLLGPIFFERIANHWQPHLEKMYQFWSAALLGIPGYRGAPFPPHASMQLEERHFHQWLHLFEKTLATHFEGPVANDALERAKLMARLFLVRIQSMDNKSIIPIY